MNSFKRKPGIFVIVFLMANLFFANATFAQSSSDWILKSDSQGVKFSYKVASCVEGNVLFFQFENSNSTPVNVNYHLILEGGTGVDVPLPQFITLGANETVAGQCQGTPALTRPTYSPSNPIIEFSMKIQN